MTACARPSSSASRTVFSRSPSPLPIPAMAERFDRSSIRRAPTSTAVLAFRCASHGYEHSANTDRDAEAGTQPSHEFIRIRRVLGDKMILVKDLRSSAEKLASYLFYLRQPDSRDDRPCKMFRNPRNQRGQKTGHGGYLMWGSFAMDRERHQVHGKTVRQAAVEVGSSPNRQPMGPDWVPKTGWETSKSFFSSQKGFLVCLELTRMFHRSSLRRIWRGPTRTCKHR